MGFRESATKKLIESINLYYKHQVAMRRFSSSKISQLTLLPLLVHHIREIVLAVGEPAGYGKTRLVG